MRYGFFGGSFNPPTKAHLEIAIKALKEFDLDKVFFVPMGNSYDKAELVDERYRCDMINLLAKNEEKINIEDIELGKKDRIFAIDAFNMIEQKYIKSENYFIMGADNFIKIPEWKENEKMIKNYKYIIFERNNINIEDFIKNNDLLQKNQKNINILKVKQNKNVNSTMLRQLIKDKDYNIEKFTTPEIIDYIKEKKLYT